MRLSLQGPTGKLTMWESPAEIINSLAAGLALAVASLSAALTRLRRQQAEGRSSEAEARLADRGQAWDQLRQLAGDLREELIGAREREQAGGRRLAALELAEARCRQELRELLAWARAVRGWQQGVQADLGTHGVRVPNPPEWPGHP